LLRLRRFIGCHARTHIRVINLTPIPILILTSIPTLTLIPTDSDSDSERLCECTQLLRERLETRGEPNS
jgi:hypothetical protein